MCQHLHVFNHFYGFWAQHHRHSALFYDFTAFPVFLLALGSGLPGGRPLRGVLVYGQWPPALKEQSCCKPFLSGQTAAESRPSYYAEGGQPPGSPEPRASRKTRKIIKTVKKLRMPLTLGPKAVKMIKNIKVLAHRPSTNL